MRHHANMKIGSIQRQVKIQTIFVETNIMVDIFKRMFLKGGVSVKDFGFNNEILILFFLKWAKQIYSEIVIPSEVICTV